MQNNNNNQTKNIKIEQPILAKFGVETNKLTNTEKSNLISNMGNKLQQFTQRNKKTTHINHSIFHLLLDPFTLDNAYSNISKNKGTFTPGSIPGNIQGYSRKESIKITTQLKNGTYTPSPVRRIWIPKPGKKEKRPLGIPTFSDRVVQEALRGILEGIYEPEFAEFEQKYPKVNNFGFRPQKNCWQAIEHFTKYGQKTNFVIEVDIKGAYNNVSHKKLLHILSKRIKDKKILNLIKQFLKAGIMDNNQYEHSIIGVPQGGILSPLLFNIYMFEFDKYMQEQIINKSETPATTNKDPRYKRALYQKTMKEKKYKEYKSTLNPREFNKNPKLKELKLELREAETLTFSTPSYDRSSELSMVYTRYADDIIIGIGSNIKTAIKIKEEIELWLKTNLELEFSPDKTKITNIRKTYVPFLGYSIYLRSKSRNTKILKYRIKVGKLGTNQRFKLTKRRTTSSTFYITPNQERIEKKLIQLKIAEPGTLFPIGKRAWGYLDEYQIVQKYHSMFLGLVGHYISCDSHKLLNRLSYIFQYSCAKTLAGRKKTSIVQIFEKYGKNLSITRQIQGKDKPLQIEFMGFAKIRDTYFQTSNRPLPIEFDPFKIRTFWRTTFKLYSECCVCGANNNIEMHHINSLKSIKDKNPTFNLILKQLNRKQIPVCKPCHIKITNGTYSNKSLKDLFNESLASL